MQHMTIMLRDVAEAAGFSVSTVSRALRGDPRISSSTSLAVKATALRLGYRPDPAVSALASYRSRNRPRIRQETIVHISTWPRQLKPSSLPAAVVDQAATLGYRLEPLVLTADADHQRAAGACLVARGIRGLLLGTGVVQQDELQLPWEQFACISVSGAPTMRWFPSVTANYAENLRLVLEQLHARGYRRPGLVLEQYILQVTRKASLAGWSHVLGMSRSRPAAPLQMGEEIDAAEIRRWVTQERLDAVIAFSSHTVGVMEAAGFPVPERLGFASLDVLPGRQSAGIRQPREACMRVALDLLATRLRQHEYGPCRDPYALQLTGSWIDGPTVRPLP